MSGFLKSPIAFPEGTGEMELYHGCIGMPLQRPGMPVHPSQNAARKALGLVWKEELCLDLIPCSVFLG